MSATKEYALLCLENPLLGMFALFFFSKLIRNNYSFPHLNQHRAALSEFYILSSASSVSFKLTLVA